MSRKGPWIHDFSEYIREQFPSLENEVNGNPIAYLDGPGGYQVPKRVIDAMEDYLINSNANIHGQFKTSEETDELILETRKVFADFFNCSCEEVIFGANMTTLNFMLAQAIKKELESGDKILITQLDHAGNRSPWAELESEGIVVEEVKVDTDDLTLDMDDFYSKIDESTKLVAVTYGSNAVGTVPDVKKIVEESHEVGAYTVIDAVHYAAHFPIDVKDIDTDFLLCSAYKFFGPHIGIMYAKKEIMAELDTLKVRPQKKTPPNKFETGTLNHEGIAGAKEAVKFIADTGEKFSTQIEIDAPVDASERRKNILAGLSLFEKYEETLTERLVEGLSEIPEIKLYRPSRSVKCTSTVSFTHSRYSPEQIASYLGDRGIFVWDGDFYATRLIEVLGLQEEGGVVRIGISPYNTLEDIVRTVEKLRDTESLKEELA
ncbi:MAG: cysteine desulfurase-like protein [Thermoplasmata archaeon]